MNLVMSLRAESLLARVTGGFDRMMGNLHVVVQRLAIKAQGVVKEQKLTGQVLHVRTGTLRRSINQQVFDTPSGVYAQVGTNVAYAGVHEFGFDGIQHVKAHTRQAALGATSVRAHDRHVHLPKRSFLISTLDDMRDEIRVSLRAAALKAVRQ